jgi:hypothetical protein
MEENVGTDGQGRDDNVKGQPEPRTPGTDGTEHLHTGKRLVTVFFENEPREIARGVYTTEQLKQLFGVQEGYVLEVINDEGQLTPLKPTAKLRVEEGMKFFEQVPCGGSS